ncbi:processed acidic surface protein [Virgibacillus sp. 6R]|uniref:processed acidic surface protein n=1 Tax=Metabacillus sp. 22489 TaxID=3453928 RepID=UPI0011AAB946
MKKLVSALFVAVLLFNNNIISVFAAPPEEEVNKLLSEMGWTQEDLQNYLDYYEMSLADFDTIEDLKGELGTPINERSLTKLLTKYNMSRDELDKLLAGFGETVDDYWFIEELDVSIDFYLNHDQYMKEAEEMLALIGLEEEEVDRFFNHLMALDETVLEQRMEEVAARLEPFLTVDPESELTEDQLNELASIWEEMMGLLQLAPKLYLVNTEGNKTDISFGRLMNMEEMNGNSLLIEIYDTQGNLLLDMQLSEDMLSSEFLLDAASQFTNVGDLAGELTNIKHEQLPKTASPFGMNMIIGLFVFVIGLSIYVKSRKTQRV